MLTRSGIVASAQGGTFVPSALESLVAWYSADNGNNLLDSTSVDFAPADVNTSTDRIAMSASGFVRSGDANAVPVRFSSTGALPSPLVANTDYLIEDMEDGTFRVFPVVDDSDYALFDGFESGETIAPYLSYSMEVGAIDFTDQGSGTHTCQIGPILRTLDDKAENSLDMVGDTVRNDKFRILTDGDDRPYIELPGPVGHKADDGAIGKKLVGASDGTFGTLMNGKRRQYVVAVAKPYFAGHASKRRLTLRPADLVAATGIFTTGSHGVVTGTEVSFGSISDNGAFPTPTVAMGATAFLRAVSTSTFSLHPTASDATNNINKYVFSDTGSGVFYVNNNADVEVLAVFRQFLLDVNTATGNNHNGTACIYTYAKNLNFAAAVFKTTSAFNGLVLQGAPTSNLGTMTSAFQVHVFIPSGSVPVTRLDTSAPLATGTYWATQQGNNLRLHQSQALAEAAVGVDVSTLSEFEVIKWDVTGMAGAFLIRGIGMGQWRTFYDTFDATSVGGNIDAYEGQLCVLVTITDFGDPVGTSAFSSGVNAVSNLLDAVASGKTDSSNTGNADSNLKLGNAAEPHVPGKFDLYELFMGASTLDPETEVGQIVAWAKAKYGI
jgi:hypothetical protein